MVIGITAKKGAGKDAVADYLVKKGFNYFSLSDEIRIVLKERNIEETHESLHVISNELRQKFGSDYLARRILLKLRRPAVIVSIRNLSEIKTLRKVKDFVLIGVDADQRLRYKRMRDRNRAGDMVTFEEFVKHEELELWGNKGSQHVGQCLKEVDFWIYNNGDFEELYKNIDAVIDRIKKQESKI